MNCLIKYFLVFTFLAVLCQAKLRKEAFMSVPALIKAAGYPIEKHRVSTEDGYELQMHRIPAGRRSGRRIGDPSAKGKKAIVILHGLMGYSGNFVIMGPDRSLAFLLADAGYDVWLGNFRGNTYSTHKRLSKEDPTFWQFSFHEHGKYDVPAMIDKVLNVTGLDRIMCVGHSMGSTSFFTMLAQKPEYNSKVIAFVALAPAVYLGQFKDIFNILLNTFNVTGMLRDRGIISYQPTILRYLMERWCNLKPLETDLCVRGLSLLAGEDLEQIDVDLMPVHIYKIQPASWGQLEHFGKIAITSVFTTLGSGLSDPVKPYNLTNIRVPVSILYGENDQLTDKYHALRLGEELRSVGVLEVIRPACNWPKFNHLDFVFAKDLGELLNKPLVKDIDELYNKYNGL